MSFRLTSRSLRRKFIGSTIHPKTKPQLQDVVFLAERNKGLHSSTGAASLINYFPIIGTSYSTAFVPSGIIQQQAAKTLDTCYEASDIESKDLQINRSKNLQIKPKIDAEVLRFGAHYTDHMLQIVWKEGIGWDAPAINPLGALQIHPCAQVLHYGIECFEGMKAYKGKDGCIRLFRPNMHMDRLLRSVKRLALPQFDKDALLDCIKELLHVEHEWIPQKEGFSIYIRPTVIATHPFLGVGPPKEAMLYVILSPVGPYFPTGLKPIRLFVDTKNVRAFPGGIGDKKAGGNYAPTIIPQLEAAKRGCSQVLYVLDDGIDGGRICESGAMNVFFLFKTDSSSKMELVTPPLDGLILPGVTRDTVLMLANSLGNIEVSERPLRLAEVEAAANSGRLLEVFGTGTACIIQPVMELLKDDGSTIKVQFNSKDAEQWIAKLPGDTTLDKDVTIPFNLCGYLTRSMMNIHYGHTESEWSTII